MNNPYVCLTRVFSVRWSRYNPYYLEPDPRKDVYEIPENELTAEQKEERERKAVSPIKAATSGVTSSLFQEPDLK